MFAKKLLQKATHHHHQRDDQHGNCRQEDFSPEILCHLGVPITSSILDVDPIQQLLAIGTLDGRIKVLGGNNIEGLLISPKQLPYKILKFLQNKGYLVGILNDNDIQVWNLENRSLLCSLQWESNITAFSVISGSLFMIVGDEYGELSILKYAPEDEKLVVMPYHISPLIIAEKTGIVIPTDQPVVGVLPQPFYFGDRLLIAYQYGLIILWDVIEADVVVFKGDKDLLIKGHLSDSPRKLDVDSLDIAHEDIYEKEISALCWASSIGSILAVGYIDGDILLWDLGAPAKCNKTGASYNDVVKLQLSSAEKRLPVIILHWCESSVSQNSCGGQLFVYGGCEIGSEEVLTVVSMKWSPGMETLKSVSRVDLAVNSAFADMVFLSSLRTPAKGQHDGLFVLTRPGELQFYDMEFLSSLASQHERKSSASGVKFPVAVPTTDPQMTATKLSSHAYDGNVSVWLSEITSISSTLSPGKCTKWPLTGGTQSEVSSADEKPQKTIYIAGYKDGSVRLWDVTNSTFSPLSILEGQLHGIENVGSNVSVTSLDFCESTMNLAVGSECGMVRVYSLTNGGGTKLHWVKHSEQKVYDIPPRKGAQCKAVFSLMNARVQSLQFSVSGTKLVVGFESGHVAVLNMQSLSVLFVTNSVASSTSPVISATIKTFSDVHDFSKGSKHIGSKNIEQPMEDLVFTVTQDSKVNVLDCKTGSTIATRLLHLKKEHTAISIYVLEGSEFMSKSSSQQHEQSNKEDQDASPIKSELRGIEHPFSSGEKLTDSLLLLCCEDVIRLYHMRSVIQGEDKPVCKANLAKSCCWTSIFRKDDKIELILVYQSGTIEIRLLPSLELMLESSLNTALRWNCRPNMENLMSSTNNGHICLVNGSEVVFFSLSTGENETKFRESLPLLHDKVIAAAGDAAICHSIKHKKQVAASGILGGFVKGFKKESNNSNDAPSLSNFLQLEGIFSQPVVPDSSLNTLENKEEQEQEDEELDIDDIEIDEPILPAATSSNQAKGKTTGKHSERLFGGQPMDTKPKTRTKEEIMAAYRGAEYASAAAERARNKLMERQEKLERIGQRTEDLRNEAEDFASMAHELARTMEERKKKWWKI